MSFGNFNVAVDERPSNTFLTESQPHLTASTVVFLSESQPNLASSDSEELLYRDIVDTTTTTTTTDIAAAPTSPALISSVTVDDVYCFSERKIGLVEQLLTSNYSDYGIGITDSKSSSTNSRYTRAYLLTPASSNKSSSNIDYAQ
jgi:hypothetical protein